MIERCFFKYYNIGAFSQIDDDGILILFFLIHLDDSIFNSIIFEFM